MTEPCEPLKAWAVSCKGFGDGPVAITVATTRAKAIKRNYTSATEAGYDVRWTDFTAVRSPEHDDLIDEHGEFSYAPEYIAEIIKP